MYYGIEMAGDGQYSREQIESLVLSLAPRADIRFEKYMIPNPEYLGFERSFGSPRGQSADFRLTLEDCRCIHLLVFEDHLLCHWDEVSPECGIVEHARVDAPNYYVGGGGLAGAAAGAAFAGKGKRVEGAVIGGVIGLVAAWLNL